MKKLLLSTALASLLLFPGCEITETDLTPVEKNYYADLIETYDVAVASGDTRTADETEDVLRTFENQVFNRKAGPVLGAINAFIPAATPFAPLLLGLLPLASKRGRKHFGKAAKAIMPGAKNPDGTKTPSPVEAMLSIGRALGLAHSSDASKAAADKEDASRKPASVASLPRP